MPNKTIHFLTGASGVGKTTLTHLLQEKYKNDPDWCILHFDNIGVPDLEEMNAQYGSPEKWQQAMTHQWAQKIQEEYSQTNIILEGQVNLDFIAEAFAELPYQIILIDCADDMILERLKNDRQQPELATENMLHWQQFLRRQAEEKQVPILSTTDKKPPEALRELEALLL